MDESWIVNILARVSDELKVDRDGIIEHLCDEVGADYVHSIKKAIVDFVLRDTKNSGLLDGEDGDSTSLVKTPPP